ncbi:quinol--cytochrome-c reductase [Ranunculus cassubicifolius]
MLRIAGRRLCSASWRQNHPASAFLLSGNPVNYTEEKASPDNNFSLLSGFLNPIRGRG